MHVNARFHYIKTERIVSVSVKSRASSHVGPAASNNKGMCAGGSVIRALLCTELLAFGCSR